MCVNVGEVLNGNSINVLICPGPFFIINKSAENNISTS